jgi:tRNA(adenine34) deaminase
LKSRKAEKLCSDELILAGDQDRIFMIEALAEAAKAEDLAEVPVGAVIVKDDSVIGRGHNLRETRQDPTAHAEMIAIRQAAAMLGSWRLLDCTLYVTLEPCVMCMGAIILARIPRLVFGCRDPRVGAVGSIYDFSRDDRFNHRVQVREGVLQQECSAQLSDFFRTLREQKRQQKQQDS